MPPMSTTWPWSSQACVISDTKFSCRKYSTIIFALLALISLPEALNGGTSSIISWVAQTFLQLVLLSVIMVGQKVAAKASDKRAIQTYKDTEALLKMQDEVLQLTKANSELTKQIHDSLIKKA